MLVVIYDSHDVVLVVYVSASLAYHGRYQASKVPHDDSLILRGGSHELAINGLCNAADPLIMLCYCLEKVAVVCVPYAN